VVGRQNAHIADTLHLRDVAMATIFGFLYMGSHWRHLANTTEQSVCGGDAALCQITLITCFTAHRKVSLLYNRPLLPSKLLLPMAGSGPHLIHDPLGPPEPSTQTASRSVERLLQSTLL